MKPYKFQKIFRGESFKISQKVERQEEKKQNNQFEKIYGKVLEIFKEEKNKISQSKLIRIQRELKQYKNFFARLLESLLYIKGTNTAKAKQVLINLLSKDFFEHVFESDLHQLDLHKQAQMMIEVVRMLKDESSLSEVVNVLIFYIDYHSQGKFKEIFEENVDVMTSSSKIRKGYERFKLGRNLPYVWAPYLFEKKSFKEYEKFVVASLKKENMSELERQKLIFFRGFYRFDKTLKKNIIEKFSSLQSLDSDYSDYLYFMILEDESFYKFVDNYGENKIGLLMNEKRELLISFLNKKHLREFALLGLLAMGDINHSYIEKSILVNE